MLWALATAGVIVAIAAPAWRRASTARMRQTGRRAGDHAQAAATALLGSIQQEMNHRLAWQLSHDARDADALTRRQGGDAAGHRAVRRATRDAERGRGLRRRRAVARVRRSSAGRHRRRRRIARPLRPTRRHRPARRGPRAAPRGERQQADRGRDAGRRRRRPRDADLRRSRCSLATLDRDGRPPRGRRAAPPEGLAARGRRRPRSTTGTAAGPEQIEQILAWSSRAKEATTRSQLIGFAHMAPREAIGAACLSIAEGAPPRHASHGLARIIAPGRRRGRGPARVGLLRRRAAATSSTTTRST